MTREEAIDLLQWPSLDEETVIADKEYIASKLRISVEDLDGFMNLPHKTYKDYKNQEWLFTLGAKILGSLGIEKNQKR